MDHTENGIMHGLRVRLFGKFEISVNGIPCDRATRHTDELVAAYLLVHHDRPRGRVAVAEVFWGTSASRFRCLTNALNYVRGRLGDERKRIPEYANPIMFDVEDADVDLIQVERAIASRDPAALERAAVCYRRGPLLEGEGEWDWVMQARRTLQKRWVEALVEAAELAEAREDDRSAARMLDLVLEVEPTSQTTMREIIQLLTRRRRFNDARQRETEFRLLLSEKHIEVEADTRRAFKELAILERAFERSPEAGSLPHTISFVPRDQEVQEIRRALAQHQVVTLTGPGGVGKSRLAIEVASQIREQYYDRVWWVELAGIADPAMVPQEVARQLGIQEAAGRPMISQLRQSLRSRHILMMLDNCEHVRQACREMVDQLCKGCDHLKVLATSREALGMGSKEQVWTVPPMGFPEPESSLVFGMPCDERRSALDALMQFGAVRLFWERAQQARKGKPLTNNDVLDIVSICARLDGIPLALELAAARCATLTPQEVLASLQARLSLLTHGDLTNPRQATMRACIDWSYNMLTAQEQELFRRLSVFVGGWTPESAFSICSPASLDAVQSLNVHAALVDKSLATPLPLERYRLLETVRAYAQERLEEAGEVAELKARHLRCFTELAITTNLQLYGKEHGDEYDRLEAEASNLDAALTSAIEVSTCGVAPRAEDELEGHPALVLCCSLIRFWLRRGYLRYGQTKCEETLKAAGARTQPLDRANVLNGAAVLARNRGDLAAAKTYGEESLGVFRVAGHRIGISKSLSNLGLVAMSEGNHDLAGSILDESHAMFVELGEKQDIAMSLHYLSLLAFCRRDYPRAVRLWTDTLTLCEELGDQWGIAASLGGMGKIALIQGSFEEARGRLTRSLEMHRRIGDRQSVCYSLEAFAHLLAVDGKGERAAELLGAAEALRERISSPHPQCDVDAYNSVVSAVAARLDPGVFLSKRALGHRLTMDQAISAALEAALRY